MIRFLGELESKCYRQLSSEAVANWRVEGSSVGFGREEGWDGVMG